MRQIHIKQATFIAGLAVISFLVPPAHAVQYQIVPAVPGVPLDAAPDKVLYVHPQNGDATLTLRTVSTGTDQILSQQPNKTITHAFITSHGAIELAKPSNVLNGSFNVFELRDSSLLDLGPSNGDGTSANPALKVQGNYAVWGSFISGFNRPLITRDLSAGTSTTILPYTGTPADVAPTGDVVYWGNGLNDYNVWQYHNGSSSLVSTGAPNSVNVYPVTDGANIVFESKLTSSSEAGSICIRTPDGTVTALAQSTDMRSPGYGYAVNNGWTVFEKTHAAGGPGFEIWERSPDGTLSFIANRSLLSSFLKVGSDGSIAYEDFGGLYLADPATEGPLTFGPIASDSLVDWVGDRWYIVSDLPEPSTALVIVPLLASLRRTRRTRSAE